MGGNAAEKMIFGDTTTGASNDIEKATALARRMVTEFGMSDKLGPLSFGKRDELVFLGREIGEQRNYSDEVAKQIDEEVRSIIDGAYAWAMDVLIKHKSILTNLAEKARRRRDGRRRGLREPLRRHPAEGEPARGRTADRGGLSADARPEPEPAAGVTAEHGPAPGGAPARAVLGSGPRRDRGPFLCSSSCRARRLASGDRAGDNTRHRHRPAWPASPPHAKPARTEDDREP